MADFCKHHSIEMWGKDTKDLVTEEPPEDSGYFYTVLCESCGMIQVNAKGERCTPLDDSDMDNPYTRQTQFFSPLPGA